MQLPTLRIWRLTNAIYIYKNIHRLVRLGPTDRERRRNNDCGRRPPVARPPSETTRKNDARTRPICVKNLIPLNPLHGRGGAFFTFPFIFYRLATTYSCWLFPNRLDRYNNNIVSLLHHYCHHRRHRGISIFLVVITNNSIVAYNTS